MGYESKLYVVEKGSTLSCSLKEPTKQWADVIAIYDASKFPALCDAFTRDTDCYIYDSDGNTEILEDCYGKPLKEASVDEIVTCLENVSDEDREYRRYSPLLAMLRAFKEESDKWNRLAILHYGH